MIDRCDELPRSRGINTTKSDSLHPSLAAIGEILAACGMAQVGPAVIGGIVILMVDIIFWPLAGHVEPSHTAGARCKPIDTNHPVRNFLLTNQNDRTSPLSGKSGVISCSICKNAGGWIVFQDLSYPLKCRPWIFPHTINLTAT